MVNEFDDRRARPHDQTSISLEKKWMEIAFNSVDECLFLLSVEPNDCFRFVSVNEKFLKTTGCTPEKVIGKRIEEVIPMRSSSSRLPGIFRQALDENKTVAWEEDRVYPTGRRLGYAKVTPLEDEESGQMYLVGVSYDLTELRAEQIALKKTEEMLSVALRTSREAFLLLHLPDEMILDVNESFLKLTGYTRKDLIGKTTADINIWSNSEDQERFTEAIREHGKVRDFEFTYRNKAGGIRHGIFSSEVIDLNGEQCAFLIGHDITNRKNAEEASRASEAELRALFAALSDIVLVFDKTGRYLKVAPTNPETPYLPPPSRIGKRLHDLFPESQANFFLAHIQTALKTRRRESIEYTLNIEGNNVWYAATIAPMADETVVWVARDISYIKQAEKEREESRNLYKETVEHANDLIYTIDLQGRYISANRAGERITGYTRDELRRMNFADLVAPEYLELVRQKMAEKTRARGGETIYELEIITKDRRRVMVEINSRLLERDGKIIGVLGIARDISERKRAEEKLNQVEEQLRQSQKLESIGLLAGGIAHDFNNMLTAINGYSDLILRRLPPDDSLRRMVEEIKKAGERAGALTYQLLAFSRKQILQTKTLNINEIVADIIKLLNRLIGEDIRLKTILNPDLGQVETDPGQMTQVLMNLAVNARDAMPKGGTLIIETDNVFLDELYTSRHLNVTPGHYVMLAVSDNGVGIDAKTLERIFEPFFTTKEVGEGTGMGLATVYGIVKQSKGSIWVYSEVGNGTTFKIYLPRIDKEAEKVKPDTADTQLPTGTEKILLVEDEDAVRNLSKQILEMCGYQVVEAINGSDAIRICEQTGGEFDLLITDVIMPEMGGRDLVERLTAKYPTLRTLYISGYTDKAIVHHGILKEGTNFIQKPFALEDFARVVREVLDAPA